MFKHPIQSPPLAGCAAWLPALSAYADGELESDRTVLLLEHLAACAACSACLAEFRQMGVELRALPVPPVPSELGLKLRVAASHFSVRDQRWLYWRMRFQTWAQALAVPTALGTAMALALFFALAGGVRSSAVNNPNVPDVQVGFGAQPPRLASMSDYQVGGSVLVEAQIDASGHVYTYRVLSGHTDAQIISRLNTQLLMSVFEPATTIFGQPTSGSLLVSFGTVDVRG